MPSGGGKTAARALRLAAAAVVVGVAVSSCTGGPAPTPSPSPEPTTTSTPDATPTPTPTQTPAPEALPPERPAAMDEASVEGAEAIARYFLELYPYVYATGDLTEWEALSHPECGFCTSVIENVREQEAAGQKTTGGTISLDAVEVVAVTESLFSVRGTAEQAEGTVTANEETLKVNQATQFSVDIAVTVAGDGLQVRGVETEENPD